MNYFTESVKFHLHRLSKYSNTGKYNNFSSTDLLSCADVNDFIAECFNSIPEAIDDFFRQMS
jgi:hypothetical protein